MNEQKTRFLPLMFFVLFFLLFVLPLSAEKRTSLRLVPLIETPFGMPQFNTGIGAAVALERTVFQTGSSASLGKFDFGICAGAGFLSLPVEASSSIFLIEGKAGPFISFHPFDRLSFNAGVNAGAYQFTFEDDTYTKLLWSFALGLDFHLSPYISLFSETGFTYRVFSENQPLSSMSVAAGLRFNLSEIMRGRARVNVEKTQQLRIFPVSWAWYEDNPVAVIKITNEEPNSITDISLSFFIDSFMGRPYTFAVLPRLASGNSLEVPVTALFNEVMLGLTENVIANGIIQIEYRSLGARREAVFPVQMPIFHRNTLSWDDDRRAAAFVSPRDSAARLFARYVESAVDLHLESGAASALVLNMPKNVRYAAAMFEALRLYGISYVVVPTMSYVNLRADESVLDNVTFPYETLFYRGGDCTYISILFCSLLEALDIKTAFITVPGHLYMAFDVGDNNWMANNPDIIELDGRRWLPLEVTIPEEGFNRAWRVGARQWRSFGEEAELWPIRESWEIYPSVTVSASVDYPPEMPLSRDIVQALEAELRR
jgi:hypothetical protein